jgi:acetyltransferase-like isoleucine patch superfamily enzyme
LTEDPMKKTHAAIIGGGSALRKYQDVMVGKRSFIALLYYEWCVLLGPVPGAVGMILRKLFWPKLFGNCGHGCMFGPGIVLRHPGRIHLGSSVIIGERCVLDGRNDQVDCAIEIGDEVMLSNDVMLSCKMGRISVGDRVGVNSHAIIQSTNDCPVDIGADCIIGQRCLLIGGGSYRIDRLDIPIREQGIRPDGGVRLAANVWLGGNVTVLGGAEMESGSVAGAGAVVTGQIEKNGICLGVPAKVVRKRP